MPNFTIEQIQEIMKDPKNIRNMSVIAHVDHGKTTLTDSLIARAGIIASNKVGEAQTTDYDEEEKNRGITIKSTGVSLYYEIDNYDKNISELKTSHLINLIDCPGHVDFSSEVTAALRSTDGALVVVDFVEGVCVQTETVLRQSLQENVKPVLMINKIDRGIIELQVSGEEMYQKFLRVIESTNSTIATYEKENEDLTVEPTLGTVCFGSAYFGFAFSLNKFARIYSKKFKVDQEYLVKKLWGDNYYDPSSKHWIKEEIGSDGKKLNRGFVEFIMNPIIKLFKNIMDDNREFIFDFLPRIGVQLSTQEQELKTKDLVKCIFMKWLNAADVLLEMIVSKLPSPVLAQSYRAAYLYEGPIDDVCGQAIKNCDANGPLMVYISKMVKTGEKGRFYAFGRVFSGTLKTGQKVRIMGPNYVPGKKHELFVKNIQRIVIMMANKVEAVSEVPCGNTVGLVGIDKYLIKSGTISDNDEAHNIRGMKYSVSPVVRVAVKPQNASDIPKLIEGLKNLSKSDPLVQCMTEESGEHIIAGCGELHIEICLKELEKTHAQIPIIVSDPVVTYKETVTDQSSILCLAKTQNRHNRLYCTASPLGEEFCLAIDNKELTGHEEPKQLSKILSSQFNWDVSDTKKIWCFEPIESGNNVLVDTTKGVQYLEEIKDHVKSAFTWVTKEGALCQEAMRGVRFNLTDVHLIADSIHRGGGQLIPAARRVYYASQLTAAPRLQEPIFLCEIQGQTSCLNGIYQCLNSRRGIIVGEEPLFGSSQLIVKAYLPVSESFGFTQHLRSLTSGKAFPQCIFDHWQTIDLDPLDSASKAGILVGQIRKRKGLKSTIPELSQFLDKL